MPAIPKEVADRPRARGLGEFNGRSAADLADARETHPVGGCPRERRGLVQWLLLLGAVVRMEIGFGGFPKVVGIGASR